jgi:hypothetical protein
MDFLMGNSKSNNGHNPARKICHWPYCIKCGLVYLKNEVTKKAIRAPCPGDIDD